MTDEKKTSTGSGLTKLLATFGTALIMFFAGIVWRAYERTDDAMRLMASRLEALEEDKSKWGTLTELKNKSVSLELEMGRLEGMMQGFALAVNGGMVEKPVKRVPWVLPLPLPLPLSIPVPAPAPEAAPKPPVQLKDPKELFKDAEEYQLQQQQKYPLRPNQQKK